MENENSRTVNQTNNSSEINYTLKYQPTCYVRAVLESESAPENLKQLVTALYLYYRMSQMS